MVNAIGRFGQRLRFGLAVSLALLVVAVMSGCEPRDGSPGRQGTPQASSQSDDWGREGAPAPCERFLPERRGNFIRWSRDGSLIVFYRDEDLYRVAADGSAVRLIETLPEETVGWHAFDLAPDGQQIVYSSCRVQSEYTYTHDLWLAGIDGRDPRRLTNLPSWDANFPAWSPDGTRIASLLDSSRVLVTALDGSGSRRIDFGDDITLEWAAPEWAPDSQRLAVTAVRHQIGQSAGTPPERAVYTAGADGFDSRSLGSNVVSAPAWSPDGRWLAYARAYRGDLILATIRADGTDERLVTRIEGWESGVYADADGWHDPRRAWLRIVAWSPDGAHLLYSCGRHLCVVTTDGRPVGRVPAFLRDGNMGAWSPDGMRVAVTGLGLDNSVLYTIARDGTQLCPLVEQKAQYVAPRRNGFQRLWRQIFGGESDHPLVAVGDCEAAG